MALEESQRAGLLARLRGTPLDPAKIRLVTLSVGVASIGLTHHVMAGRLEELGSKLKRERDRAEIVSDMEALRVEEARLRSQVPGRASPSFWIEYLIDAVRQSGLVLKRMTPSPPKKRSVAGRQAVEIQLDVEGSYAAIVDLVLRSERGRWPVRLTRVTLAPSGDVRAARIFVAVLVTGERP